MDLIDTDPVAPFWTQVTTLDGTPYLLTFRYNGREACYYLDIDSVDGLTNFIKGLKIVVNFPLLAYTGVNPPGELLCVSTSPTNDSPPGIGELGDGLRCQLVYITEAELFTATPPVEAQRFQGFLV